MSAKEYNPAEIENFIQESWKMHYSPNFSHSQAPWGWVVRRARPADPPPRTPSPRKLFLEPESERRLRPAGPKGNLLYTSPEPGWAWASLA